jgi:putative transposase
MHDRQEVGRHLNNSVENSHMPFRRKERTLSRFSRISNLQKFAPTRASFHNHFSLDRFINRRDMFKSMRNAALSE